MAVYIVIIGAAAFLEKPALMGLDATQLNGLLATAMTAVAGVALAVKGPWVPITKPTLEGIGDGATIGVASVFYCAGIASAFRIRRAASSP
jgi:hypothetical protein